MLDFFLVKMVELLLLLLMMMHGAHFINEEEDGRIKSGLVVIINLFR